MNGKKGGDTDTKIFNY